MFTDLRKAQDKVPQRVPWRCLEAKSVSVDYIKDIKAIKDIYDGAKTRVSTVGGDSENFPTVMSCISGWFLVCLYFLW